VRVALRLREGQTLVVPGVAQERVPAVAHRGKNVSDVLELGTSNVPEQSTLFLQSRTHLKLETN
jgi:hypothetical protein